MDGNRKFSQAVEKRSSLLEFILSNSKGGDGVCMLRCVVRQAHHDRFQSLS